MIPGFVYRMQTKEFMAHEPLHSAEHAAALAGQAFLFTAEIAFAGKTKLSPYAQFHLATGESIRSVIVSHGAVDNVRIFHIGDASPLLFAAALSAVVGLLAEEETKPDFLHIFDAADSLGTLLCKQYFHIPYIYSVYDLREEKRPISDLEALGLSLPTGCAKLGQMYLPQQATAQEALYCIDENGATMPQFWHDLFCGCPGNVVTGVPAVDTAFWGHAAEEGSSRGKRKAGFLAARNLSATVVAVCGNGRGLAQGTLPADILLLEPEVKPEHCRELLQSADFYIFDSETGRIKELLMALAAGCIPIVSSHNLTAGTVTAEGTCPEGATGYIYQAGEETWLDALLRAAKDLRTRPQWQDVLRQRGAALIRNRHSLRSAAQLHHRVYRGFAPVKLPFLVHQQRQAPYNGGYDHA